MRKVREAVSTIIRLLRGGAFAGNHKPIRYDSHTMATAGDPVARMEAQEDRADIIASARADREATIVYQTERASW